MKVKLILASSLFVLLSVNRFSLGAEISQTKVSSNKSQNLKSLSLKAKGWGLTTQEYRKYLGEMENTPASRWWKNVDPPQVLGMNATTENERMKFAMIDVRMDHERSEREIAFQHAYSKAFEKVYPNAKVIAINTDSNSESKYIHDNDRYYLFTAVNDPEGGMISSKLLSLLSAKFNVSLNIFFVGQASSFAIQNWARGNNLPVKMKNGNAVTLNHNLKEGNNTLKEVLGKTDVSLPVLVRVRDKHSSVISLANL